MFKIYYRGYILIRLKVIGTEWEVVKRLTNLSSNNPDEDWAVTYTTPVYGGWDLVAECKFTKLQELDKILAYIRVDDDLSNWIEETTTLVSSKPNYPK